MKAATRAAKALTEAGFGKYKTSIECTTADAKEQQYTLELKVVDPDHGRGRSYSYKPTHELTLTKPFTAEAKKLLRETKALRKKIQGLQSQIVEVRKMLADLPALERKARATMAEHALRSSGADGQQLIEQMTNLKALPLPTR